MFIDHVFIVFPFHVSYRESVFLLYFHISTSRRGPTRTIAPPNVALHDLHEDLGTICLWEKVSSKTVSKTASALRTAEWGL